MDAVWLLSLSLAGGGLVPGAPVVALGVLAAGAALVALRGRPALTVALLALFAIGAGRASRAIARHTTAERAAPRALPGAPRLVRCGVTGTVASSPTRVSSGAAVGNEASVRLLLEEVTLACEPDDAARALAGRVVLHVAWADGEALRRGDRVEAFASLAPPQRFVVPELGDDRPGRARGGAVLSGGAVDLVRLAKGRGPPAWIDEARRHVRARILATFPPRAEALARALVLGENDLAAEDARDFRDGGLSHLLAVSGMHLVLAVNGAVLALTALFCRVRWLALRVVPRRLASLLGLAICWIYCDFSGSSGSAVRAAWMLSVQLLAAALGRRVRPLRALGWSVLLMAVVEPLVAVDVSFALSAAATLGLIALQRVSRGVGPGLAERLARAPAPARFVGQSLATTLAATVPCAPILLRMGPALSLGSLVANVVAVPLGEAAALPICLSHALLAPLPRAERGAALAGGGALLLVGRLAHFTAASRLGRVALPRPTDAQLGLLAVLALAGSGAPDPRAPAGRPGAAAARRRRIERAAQVSALAGLALAELYARRAGAPRGALRVTFLDVGQGDAALVDLPSGEALLIDAGGLVGSAVDPGERVVAPLLRARRRGALAAVIVSHPHPDHFMGLRAALDGVRVGEVWDTGEARVTAPSAPNSPYGARAYAAVLAELEARGARVRRPDTLCGTHQLGGAEITVLAPCPAFAEDRGTNDNSLVLRVRFGDRAVLFVGDAEHAEEGLVLEQAATPVARGSLRADVLKVGHHGSRTSSSDALLDAVAPRLAVASCGVRNRYGHPHPVTTERFRARAIPLFRTDCLGTVEVRTDGGSLDVTPPLGDAPCP